MLEPRCGESRQSGSEGAPAQQCAGATRLLLGGTGKGAAIILVERVSRFVLLAPLSTGRTGLDVRLSLTQMIGRLPEQLRQSLTWDQGKEMSEHAWFSLESRGNTPAQALDRALIATSS